MVGAPGKPMAEEVTKLEELRAYTVAKQWEDFRQSTMPEVTDPVQIEEKKRSFFCGFLAAILSMSASGDDAISEDEGVERVETWMKECTQFIFELTVEQYGERPTRQ